MSDGSSAYSVEPWMPVPAEMADAVQVLEAVADQAAPLAREVPPRSTSPSSTEVGQPGEAIAVARSYEDLVAACRLRRHELGLPQLAVDDIAGLQSGYVGKIECGEKRLGPMSLPCLLQALGLELVVIRCIPHHLRRAA